MTISMNDYQYLVPGDQYSFTPFTGATGDTVGIVGLEDVRALQTVRALRESRCGTSAIKNETWQCWRPATLLVLKSTDPLQIGDTVVWTARDPESPSQPSFKRFACFVTPAFLDTCGTAPTAGSVLTVFQQAANSAGGYGATVYRNMAGLTTRSASPIDTGTRRLKPKVFVPTVVVGTENLIEV